MPDRRGFKDRVGLGFPANPVTYKPPHEPTSDTMNVILKGLHLGKTAVCIPILRSLPEWFGVEDPIAHYASEIDRLPTFPAINSEHVIGFLSLK